MTTSPGKYHLQYDSQRLLLVRDEVQWTARLDGAPQRSDVVVNFGCGQQLTPHLMLETVDVLSAFGLTVTAVAGSQWCCGMAVDDDDPQASLKVVRGSVRRMARFSPHTTVHACGAWWPQTARLVDGGEVVPFDLAYIADYVLRALEPRVDDITWQELGRRRALVHLKNPETDAETLAQRANSVGIADARVLAILGMIPGLEVAGEVEAPALGAPCQDGPDDETLFEGLTPEERATIRADLAGQAARADADLLVCVHHQCFREWGKFGGDALRVRHYISVLAEAMGLPRPNRYHACWELPTIEDIVDETRPAWQSWDLSREDATSMATDMFPTHPRA